MNRSPSGKTVAGSAISVDDPDASYPVAARRRHRHGHADHPFSTQEDADGWACQHALSVVSNVTVEAWACGYSITEEAATMANDMVENAAK